MATQISNWKDPSKPLVIHFHGGLVSRTSGASIADRLEPRYSKTGAVPLFFVWQSGWDEAIKYNLAQTLVAGFRELADKGVLQTVLKKALRYAADSLGILDSGLLGFAPPHSTVTEGEIDAKVYEIVWGADDNRPLGLSPDSSTDADAPFEAASKDADRTVEASPEFLTELEAKLEADSEVAALDEGPPEFDPVSAFNAAATIAGIVFRTIDRFNKGRDHGLYPTVLEETAVALKLDAAGRLLQWERMKEDTADAFNGPASTHAGTALVEELAAVLKADPTRRIVIVAHSAGAIYACHLLKHADAKLPAGATFDLVLLAPACTFELFDDTRRDYGKRIGNVRMFGMSDEVECNDKVAPPVYTRSLLYLVSGILEKERDHPILGMQRYHTLSAYDQIESVKNVRKYFTEMKNRNVWSLTAADAAAGLNCLTRAHGDFDNDESMLASIDTLLANWQE